MYFTTVIDTSSQVLHCHWNSVRIQLQLQGSSQELWLAQQLQWTIELPDSSADTMTDSDITMERPISEEAAVGSQTTAADSDIEWLEELFRIPETAEPDSDDEWLLELCRMPSQQLHRTVAASQRPVEVSMEQTDAKDLWATTQQIHNMLMEELPLGIHMDPLITDFSTAILQSNWEQQLNLQIMNIIQRSGGIVVYKIGITSDPSFRMYNPVWGYAPTEGFEEMHLLLAASPTVCAQLERKLIALNREKQGCRNTAPGGENTPPTPPCYTYLVTVACGDGLGIQQRGKSRCNALHGVAKKARVAQPG